MAKQTKMKELKANDQKKFPQEIAPLWGTFLKILRGRVASSCASTAEIRIHLPYFYHRIIRKRYQTIR